MGNKELILDFLAEVAPGKICDDCLSVELDIYPRQQINQICRRLVDDEIISRYQAVCSSCHKSKIVNSKSSAPGIIEESILKKKNVLLCVDGIQQVGAIPLDVRAMGVDFLAADGHKWLLSLEGLGFFFCHENLLDRLHPATVGWKSVVNALEFQRIDFTLRPDAARVEPGSLNTAGIYALGASVELLSGIGIDLIFERISSLIDEFAEGITRRGFRILSWLGEKERSDILVFTTGKKDREIYEHLHKNNIVTSLRGGGIRLSPHFYNNEEDVRRFFDALDKTSH